MLGIEHEIYSDWITAVILNYDPMDFFVEVAHPICNQLVELIRKINEWKLLKTCQTNRDCVANRGTGQTNEQIHHNARLIIK